MKNVKEFSETKTQAFNKLMDYFLGLIQTDKFQNEIEAIKEKYSIGKDQFQPNNRNKGLGIPDKWQFKKNPQKIKGFRGDVELLCEKYHLDFLNWYPVLQSYIFYKGLIAITSSEQHGLCIVYDIDEKRGKSLKNDKLYPVIMRISPYATERDLLSFIKNSYTPVIQPLQNQYKNKKVKIGKIRRPNPKISNRNDFIYQNKNLPLKEIRKKLANEWNEFLDDGHIGKIISLKNKKRKEL